MCILIFSTDSDWKISHYTQSWKEMIKNVYLSSYKVPLFWSDFYKNLNFLDRFSKSTQISNFMKICLLEAEFFHADGRTDGQT